MQDGIHGFWVAAATPLDATGQADAVLLGEHARSLFGQGCDGLVLFGTTGEGTSFSAAERIAVVQALLDQGIAPERLALEVRVGRARHAAYGASSPLSAASTASFRTAVRRTLIEIGPSPRTSSATRQASTVAFVKPPGRGSSMYQLMNSSSPRLYTRRVIGEETLSSTKPVSLRHSAPGRQRASWYRKIAPAIREHIVPSQ